LEKICIIYSICAIQGEYGNRITGFLNKDLNEMTLAKKLMFLVTTFALLASSSNSLQADEFCVDNGGCGFNACCRSSSLAPAIALGTIALIAIVAVAVQNTSGHAHCHTH
jgi:hypothetical protein